MILFSQYGTSKECNENKKGFPILRLNELEDGFIIKPEKYCQIISKNEYESLRLKKDDIVIIRTNGNPDYVGKSAVIMEDSECGFASYLYRVRINSQMNSATFVSFLNSKYGRVEINKNSIKGNQTNFSPEKLKNIKFPIIDNNIQNVIKEIYVEAYSLNINYKKMLIEALKILKKAILVKDIFNANNSYSIRKFSEAFTEHKRLDAEFYQGQYQIFEDNIKKGQYSALSDIADVYRGDLIDEKLYNYIDGTKYLRGADIKDNILSEDKLVHIDYSYKKKNEFQTTIGDLVFPMIGTVGNIAYVTNEYENSFISNNLGAIRINDKKILPEYLYIYLSSTDMGGLYFEKYLTRTAQPKISDADIKKFLVPILPMDSQKEIQRLVLKSFNDKKKSLFLLNKAKRAVEIAIEKSEEEAIKFLESSS